MLLIAWYGTASRRSIVAVGVWRTDKPVGLRKADLNNIRNVVVRFFDPIFHQLVLPVVVFRRQAGEEVLPFVLRKENNLNEITCVTSPHTHTHFLHHKHTYTPKTWAFSVRTISMR